MGNLSLALELGTVIERGPGRPKKYVTLDFSPAVGTTSVLSRFIDSGPIAQWAFKVGKSGAEKLYDEAPKGIGSLVHDIVTADIHGVAHPSIPPAYEAPVISAYSAWRDWVASSRIEIVATEVPLVSEKWRYGGTIDCVARFPTTGLNILDWKTANGIYVDHLMQVAAYGELWTEHREPITGYHIVRFSKEHGDFTHKFLPNLADAFEEFILLRQAYDIDKRLAARVK